MEHQFVRVNICVKSVKWNDYELLDTGNRRKLERFGNTVLIRSEPKAWWSPALPATEWQKADAEFLDSGKWRFYNKDVRRSWEMHLFGISLEARLTDMSKHVGIFPEQEPHWSFLREQLLGSGKSGRVLNLFGYTGVASLVGAASGYEVTHVDASKPAIAWGRENQRRSGMENKPVRWILEDALKYVNREIRRKSTYDAILLDPPSFGRGPNKEVWKVEDNIVTILNACKQVLTDQPLFVLLTMYNLEASSLMLGNLIQEVFGKSGSIEIGELAPQETSSSQRMLPLSLYGKWIAS